MNILVTGGSRGIGRAIALALAQRGARIALHFRRNEEAARSALEELPQNARHALFPADLSRPGEPGRLWDAVATAFGRVDVLINNAAVYEEHPPLAASPAQWQDAWAETLALNLIAPAHLCHAAAQAMAAQGGGRIVNVSSRGAFRGEPRAPAYGASKAGLNSLSQSLAVALAPQGVYVFCIAPGWVATDMAAASLNGPRGGEIRAQHPLGRVATAEEIAQTAVFCACDAPPALTGAILDVNGASYLRN